jgi:hypothetical protein
LVVARTSLVSGRAATRLLSLSLLWWAGCGGGGGGGGPVSWPTLTAGDRYFETGGRMAPLFMRNVSAASAGDFTSLFDEARAAGTTVVRLQLTQGFGYDTHRLRAPVSKSCGRPVPATSRLPYSLHATGSNWQLSSNRRRAAALSGATPRPTNRTNA